MNVLATIWTSRDIPQTERFCLRKLRVGRDAGEKLIFLTIFKTSCPEQETVRANPAEEAKLKYFFLLYPEQLVEPTKRQVYPFFGIFTVIFGDFNRFLRFAAKVT